MITVDRFSIFHLYCWILNKDGKTDISLSIIISLRLSSPDPRPALKYFQLTQWDQRCFSACFHAHPASCQIADDYDLDLVNLMVKHWLASCQMINCTCVMSAGVSGGLRAVKQRLLDAEVMLVCTAIVGKERRARSHNRQLKLR